jgi:hypothetical protein
MIFVLHTKIRSFSELTFLRLMGYRIAIAAGKFGNKLAHRVGKGERLEVVEDKQRIMTAVANKKEDVGCRISGVSVNVASSGGWLEAPEIRHPKSSQSSLNASRLSPHPRSRETSRIRDCSRSNPRRASVQKRRKSLPAARKTLRCCSHNSNAVPLKRIE